MNPITLQSIAQALWMKDYHPAAIAPALLKRIESAENSERAFAERFLARLDQLAADRKSFTPDSAERYALLRRHCEDAMAMSPRAFYASCLFLGAESNAGYDPVPRDPSFEFPGADLPQLSFQNGWHFFVGNFFDQAGQHYSVELMFWQYALLPPALAGQLGLSDIENQSVEMHLAICDPQAGVQYRANTVVVAGTSGLVELQSRPFAYRLGRNAITGLSPGGDLFPARLQACGWDMGKAPDVEFEIDLSLDNLKGYILQGEGGCAPSVDGLGTLYYSAPLLGLRPGCESALTIDGKRIVLTGGGMWYDHQWTAGFMPKGAARHAVMRAAGNCSTPPPGGWDWFELQFHGNDRQAQVQMTFAAVHSLANCAWYWQTGAQAPDGEMSAAFRGKFIDATSTVSDITGTMTVTSWVKVAATPNPGLYPPTHTWYPAGYLFEIDQDLQPPHLAQFTLHPLIASGQTGFFGTGVEYTEGGAIVRDLDGKEIGRGFAEGTNWANTDATVITLAGLPLNAETRSLMTPLSPSPLLRLVSELYTFLHRDELQRILAESKYL